jgi:hypothetical protein
MKARQKYSCFVVAAANEAFNILFIHIIPPGR